jgi:pantetheine-phosphate adenylyltransferase
MAAIDADFDALIVSEETLPVAVEINKLRRERRKRKVDIHQISCVLAEDGHWISSTRIYRGEIDIHGHLLK